MDTRGVEHHFSGNAAAIGAECRSWFVGPYHADCHPMLARRDVEMKWGTHPAGKRREGWDDGSSKWTMSLLVSGHFRLSFVDGDHELTSPGEFVIWRPWTPHTWQVIADSVVMTVRWTEDNGTAVGPTAA